MAERGFAAVGDVFLQRTREVVFVQAVGVGEDGGAGSAGVDGTGEGGAAGGELAVGEVGGGGGGGGEEGRGVVEH